MLARHLREDTAVATPILMLTARDTVQDKLEGFAAGGDNRIPVAVTAQTAPALSSVADAVNVTEAADADAAPAADSDSKPQA